VVRSCVHFGAGALGRGLVVPRLVAAGWSVVVVDPLQGLLDTLRQAGGYPLELPDADGPRRVWVPVAAALHPLHDSAAIATLLGEVQLVTTAVRKENLPATVRQVAAAWVERMPERVAMVGCENVERVDEVLGAAFDRTGLTPERRARIALPRTVVDRICASAWPDDAAIRTEVYTELAASLTGIDLPGIDVARDIDGVFDRKRYLVNTLADAAAILGLERGYALLSEAFGDDAILDALAPLVAVLKRHLMLLHGFALRDLDAYAETSRRRLADTFIPRRLDTVARDVWRKMQPGERFFAPLIDLQHRACLDDPAALAVVARLVVLGSGPGSPPADIATRLRGLAEGGTEATATVYDAVAARVAGDGGSPF
jgi:mannitol-1-phosphate 5-dehydrogenase